MSREDKLFNPLLHIPGPKTNCIVVIMPTIMFCLKLNSFPISRLIEKPRKREQSDKADKSNIFCLSLLDVTLKVYVGTSQGMLSLTTHIFYIQLLMKVSNLSQQPTIHAIILLHKILYEYMII